VFAMRTAPLPGLPVFGEHREVRAVISFDSVRASDATPRFGVQVFIGLKMPPDKI